MSAPPFEVGQEGIVGGGIRYRVVQGYKGPTDQRLDIVGPSTFTPVSMELGFIMADFFFQNEDRYALQSLGNEGGNYYLRKIREASERGWHPVSAELRAQREAKRRRREGFA